MNDIQIGIIGSGGMAARHAERFSQTEGFALNAIAARNNETGSALAGKHNVPCFPKWEDLIARQDIDAIVVCTNNDSHGQIILNALDARKHIFTEYPIARSIEDVNALDTRIESSDCVIRVSHSDPLSASHQALKAQAHTLGGLMVALFTRLTPGRGARPEVLFNLPVSGPPAVFFVYHIYALIDMFGPAAWVEGAAHYEGLTEEGRYDRFVNTVTVGFERGGIGQWNWAGGIAIEEAEETRRIILTGGTLIQEGAWRCSTPDGDVPMPEIAPISDSLQTQFLKDIQGDDSWRSVAQTAINAVRVGLAAERSANENRRTVLSELTV